MTIHKPRLTKRISILLTIALLIPITALSGPAVLSASALQDSSRADLTGVHVAVYSGDGALPNSATALRYMFTWMNATTEYVDGEDIRNGVLDTCDILAFPGGSTLEYSIELEPEGIQEVRDFVINGGSYFGICGGSLFAIWGLELFNGSYSGSVNGTGTFLMNMNVNIESTGPDLSDEPDSYSVCYWGSAYFYGEGMNDAIPIMTYPDSGEAAMIALRYELGTVFLSSPHPEYEEGDDRDGTASFDNLNDPDSEWGLLLKVSIWLVEESGTETIIPPPNPLTESPIILIGLVVTLGIAAVVVLIVRRR
ncbi:MAG: BPL-N domain-containing protein [Candidatus Thorarchaeota archaeon]|jgi:glutamine amidotransferase-like uncharacterized protein